MNLLRICIIIAVAALASACATGPKFTEVSTAIPALKASEGRIYIYRNTIFGATLRPDIYLNEQIIGESVANGFFFVDRAPGSMSIRTATEVEKKVTFNLEAGQIRYVKVNIAFGIIVGRAVPELVDKETGEKEIKETSYTGRSTAKSKM